MECFVAQRSTLQHNALWQKMKPLPTEHIEKALLVELMFQIQNLLLKTARIVAIFSQC